MATHSLAVVNCSSKNGASSAHGNKSNGKAEACFAVRDFFLIAQGVLPKAGVLEQESQTPSVSCLVGFRRRIERICSRGMHVPIDPAGYAPDDGWQHIEDDEQASKDISDQSPGHSQPHMFFCWEGY